MTDERVLFEQTMAPEFPDAPVDTINFAWWIWCRARSIEEGNCESCVGDKCRTGAKCVTLERDNAPISVMVRLDDLKYVFEAADSVRACGIDSIERVRTLIQIAERSNE